MTAELNAKVFALTGGIGSGKSSVAQVWREAGLPIVDADLLARAVVAPGTAALRAIEAEFGASVLTQEGTLDRQKLGDVVFKDENARARLNAIVHPQVRAAADAAFQVLDQQGETLICYEVPLLFETNQEERFRPVVVVTSTPLQQMERIAARDGLSPAQVNDRIKAQIPLRDKEQGADVLIVNGSGLDALRARALAALDEVRAAVAEG